MNETPTPTYEPERAVQLAYEAVSRRERTEAELRTYLERKRVDPAHIEVALQELRSTGFVDDASYARRFTEDRRTLERWGSERIARDLVRRGVAPHIVEEALADREREDELGAALEVLAERVRVPPADDRGRDRAWKMLVRRGYGSELAYDAVRAFEHRAA